MQSDINACYEVIRQLNPNVTDEEWNYFQSGFTIKTFKFHEFFIEAGKRNH